MNECEIFNEIDIYFLYEIFVFLLRLRERHLLLALITILMAIEKKNSRYLLLSLIAQLILRFRLRKGTRLEITLQVLIRARNLISLDHHV